MARGSYRWTGKTLFSFLKRSHRIWGPLCPLFKGYRSSFPGVKRLGTDFDQSSPPGVEVKYGWNQTSAPRLYFHGLKREELCLVCVIMQQRKGRIKERKQQINQEQESKIDGKMLSVCTYKKSKDEKSALQQATKTQSVSRGIALLFL